MIGWRSYFHVSLRLEQLHATALLLLSILQHMKLEIGSFGFEMKRIIQLWVFSNTVLSIHQTQIQAVVVQAKSYGILMEIINQLI